VFSPCCPALTLRPERTNLVIPSAPVVSCQLVITSYPDTLHLSALTLQPERTNLVIREDRRRGVFVEGLSEWVVRSPAEVYQLMERGQALVS
jgi:hypothetical protein